MKKRLRLSIYFSLLLLTWLHCQEGLTIEERTAIKKARDISYDFDESLWKNFNEPPFSILFVGRETEFLIDHYYQPDGFSRHLYDTLFHSAIYIRPASEIYPKGTLDFHGLYTISTTLNDFRRLNYEEKVLFLIKERMHQYQYSSERFFLELNKLALFDINQIKKTGIFKHELNTYESKTSSGFNQYVNSLLQAVISLETPEMDPAFREFIEARKLFNSLITLEDRKYIEFIKYHEGIALYAQYQLLQVMERKDSTYRDLKYSFIQNQMQSTNGFDLNNLTNEVLSQIGFLEAILLDTKNPFWTKKYLDYKFDLTKFFDEFEP